MLFDDLSCWYLVLVLLWSTYQGTRGVVETRIFNRDQKWSMWEKVFVLYIHDFAFRFVCTAAGFTSLFVCYRIVSTIDLPSEVSAGGATLLISSFLLAVVGIGGQLHYVVLLGKMQPHASGGN